MAQTATPYATLSTQYEGVLFSPEAPGPLDGVGVLIAHDFMGVGENQLSLARTYAAQGATVLVADFYGTSVRPSGPEQATAEAMRVRGDVPELRAAMQAALSTLAVAGIAPGRTAVIGTSVGGLAALVLGRTGADLGAVVVLWGILENTAPASAQKITAPVTLLQGELDPYATEAVRSDTVADLTAAGTPHELVVYSGAAHAFTLPSMGDDPSTGFAYDADATQQAMATIDQILRGL